MVKKLYFEITKSDSNRQYQNLLVTFNFDVSRYNDQLFQEVNESLMLVKKAVQDKWLSWLELEFKETFNNIIIASETQEKQLSKYIFSSWECQFC